MSVAVAIENEVRYTPEDLLSIPDGEELRAHRRPARWSESMGAESSWIEGRAALPAASGSARGCDWAASGPPATATSASRTPPARVRRPGFVPVRSAAGRLPGDELPQGHVRIAPDLAVEVVSPRDLAPRNSKRSWRITSKAGVPLVWVVYPRSRGP